MLATPWPAPFDGNEWVFELKWDGIRCLLSGTDTGVRLTSRAGNDMTARYPELAALEIPPGLVLDGEVVALDEAGRPSFELLQSRMGTSSRKPTPVSLVVFDLLQAGERVTELALEDRHELLSRLDLPTGISVSDRFAAESTPIWSFVEENDLEGIVAKKLGSRYQCGVRSPDWRKIGNFKQLRAVVGGYTAGTGGRSSSFGSLLLGLWSGERLRWIGAVGSGFDDETLRAIRTALDRMTVAECPFDDAASLPAGSTWVDPQLVAMVRFKQWTAAGRVRAPSFKGFTDDRTEDMTWAAEGPRSSGSIGP